MKRQLKTTIRTAQNGHDAINGEPLPEETSLYDTDRIISKMDGGTYLLDNTRVVMPRVHMLRHGTLRTRTESLDEIKNAFDDRVQTMKLVNKINNQLLSYQRRTDSLHPETEAYLEDTLKSIKSRLSKIDRELAALISKHPDPLAQIALKVPGLGPITVTALTVYIDLEKAATPSALWKYAGLHTSSRERYKKGVAGGGNKTLRCILWNAANSMMKNKKCAYRVIYDRVKERLAASEKVTTSNNTQGKAVEVMWKDTKPSHRHGAALRAIMKRVLAHYWLIGRTHAGLPITTPYVEGVLGHQHIDSPSDFGW